MPKVNTKKRYIVLGFILILLIFFHYMRWIEPVEVGIRSLLIPIGTTANKWRINIADSFNPSETKNDIAQKYNQCNLNNQQIQINSADLDLLKKENAELKSQLDFVQGKKYKMITTSVVGKNTDSIENMIIINAGESSGIKEGQPVVTDNGILVGTVAKVDNDISMVRLLSDNQSKIAATILNKDGSLGVVEGGYGLSVRMNFIPRDENVLVGNQIVTSGLDGSIPRGLLIGEVAVSENEAYQPFQQAILTTSADLSKLTIVSVLISD